MGSGNIKIGEIRRVGFVKVEIAFVETRAGSPGDWRKDVRWKRKLRAAEEKMLI